MTVDAPYDDGISPYQNANLLPGCRAVLPIKSGVQLVLAVGGRWTKGSTVEVLYRSRAGGTTLTITENSIVPLPQGTQSIVITPIRALPGFNLEARILPLATGRAGDEYRKPKAGPVT